MKFLKHFEGNEKYILINGFTLPYLKYHVGEYVKCHYYMNNICKIEAIDTDDKVRPYFIIIYEDEIEIGTKWCPEENLYTNPETELYGEINKYNL